MKLYFDTTTWIRLYETNLDKKNQQEQDAIDDILQKIDEESLIIISSKFQLNQLYSLSHSVNNSSNKNDAIAKAIAHCLETTGITTNTSPYCKQELDEFMVESKIQHKEDGRHIIIAWIREADYFITTDYELFKDKKSDIEKALNKMWHPLSPIHSQRMSILNPVGFLPKID